MTQRPEGRSVFEQGSDYWQWVSKWHVATRSLLFVLPLRSGGSQPLLMPLRRYLNPHKEV